MTGASNAQRTLNDSQLRTASPPQNATHKRHQLHVQQPPAKRIKAPVARLRGAAYTFDEVVHLLHLVEDALPVSDDEWIAINHSHMSKYPHTLRTTTSLRSKFSTFQRASFLPGSQWIALQSRAKKLQTMIVERRKKNKKVITLSLQQRARRIHALIEARKRSASAKPQGATESVDETRTIPFNRHNHSFTYESSTKECEDQVRGQYSYETRSVLAMLNLSRSLMLLALLVFKKRMLYE
ncbi:unnamed protein product [Agarophyton chilense]|eukprot:gb/GEZJ01000483.1/.p1 GENE.gb/GEZJ01000483.1/~~gb/GEZJ01000483.1/.p1  ORF type:complete len:239 (-),score=26.13 gb/GEZJ01000483.1/:291-1007(-)